MLWRMLAAVRVIPGKGCFSARECRGHLIIMGSRMHSSCGLSGNGTSYDTSRIATYGKEELRGRRSNPLQCDEHCQRLHEVHAVLRGVAFRKRQRTLQLQSIPGWLHINVECSLILCQSWSDQSGQPLKRSGQVFSVQLAQVDGDF